MHQNPRLRVVHTILRENNVIGYIDGRVNNISACIQKEYQVTPDPRFRNFIVVFQDKPRSILIIRHAWIRTGTKVIQRRPVTVREFSLSRGRRER